MDFQRSEAHRASLDDARRLGDVLPLIARLDGFDPGKAPTNGSSELPIRYPRARPAAVTSSGCTHPGRTFQDESDRVWQEVCRALLPVVRRMTNIAVRQVSYRERIAGFGEDVVQDIFCRLLERDRAVLRRLASLSTDSALAYLYTLIRRRLIDRSRRMNASCRQGDLTATPLVSATGTPAGPESSPERRFMVREARRQLRRALARVATGRYPARESRVFELAVVDGWRSPEIADAVHPKMSPGAVDVAVCRVRKKLENRFFSEIGELTRRSRDRPR